MDMKPQNVLDHHGDNAIFMVWNFKMDLDVNDAFQRICKLVINLNNSADVRFPDCGVSCVMGIGYDAWFQLHLPVPMPKELENFVSVVGEKHTAVSSKGDLHFHIRGNGSSVCYDMAHAISDVLEPVAISIEEIHGFRFWDGRSILGFVDGTENPQLHINLHSTEIYTCVGLIANYPCIMSRRDISNISRSVFFFTPIIHLDSHSS
jgi:porphyrinogen peroxidase